MERNWKRLIICLTKIIKLSIKYFWNWINFCFWNLFFKKWNNFNQEFYWQKMKFIINEFDNLQKEFPEILAEEEDDE